MLWKKLQENHKKLLTNSRWCGNLYSQGTTPDIEFGGNEI